MSEVERIVTGEEVPFKASDEVKEVSIVGVAQEVPVRRKRGRPPKVRATYTPPPSIDSVSGAPVVEQLPRRKRGRPRKTPLAVLPPDTSPSFPAVGGLPAVRPLPVSEEPEWTPEMLGASTFKDVFTAEQWIAVAARKLALCVICDRNLDRFKRAEFALKAVNTFEGEKKVLFAPQAAGVMPRTITELNNERKVLDERLKRLLRYKEGQAPTIGAATRVLEALDKRDGG